MNQILVSTSVPTMALVGIGFPILRSSLVNFVRTIFRLFNQNTGLRSFEKHGLMPFVRRVFVLYDSDRHRAPQFLREGQTSIRLLTHSEVLNGTKFADRLRGVHVVMAHLHRVTALSERFLVVHDDMMLVRPFDWSMHFSKDNKPLHQVHTKFITKEEKRYFPGHSDKRVMWGDEHVPIFVRKLVLAQMEETMEYSCSSNNTQEVCEFPHFAFYSFYQTFALFNGFGEVKRRGEQLGTEVHVIKCFLQRSLIAAVVAKRPQWLNLQGLGVSDEYTKCDANRIVVDKWFWSTFPKAADWENPEWEKW
jgi:hypothetical protein